MMGTTGGLLLVTTHAQLLTQLSEPLSAAPSTISIWHDIVPQAIYTII